MDSSSSSAGAGLTGDARTHAIQHAGKIAVVPFQIGIGVLTGSAIVVVALRYVVRHHHVRKLFLDDYLLLFGTACLVAATGLLYWFIDDMFIFEALIEIPEQVTFASVLANGEVGALLDSNKIIQSYLSMVWTAIFAVKFSFMAYFRSLGASFSRPMTVYYWAVVALTFASWGVCIGGGFINCPYFGIEGVKCLPNDTIPRFTAVTAVLTALDVLTDIMVVSIPIAILHRVKTGTRQKAGLGALLSLSLVMVVVAFVRMAGIIQPSQKNLDVTWEMFWQHVEGCVAVAMGSLTAFRSLLNRAGRSGYDGGEAERRSWAKILLRGKTRGSGGSTSRDQSTETKSASSQMTPMVEA
ncbi:hypothetical protein SLS54_000026 [Diplodia seriata]